MALKIVSRVWLVIMLSLIAINSLAAVPAWNIVPNQSSLQFTAIQNGSPVTGRFKTFNGNINFDPAQLNASHVAIAIDLASVTTSYTEVADTLKKPDWFDSQKFPQATFKADKFTKTGANSYQAEGMLTLRDKTLPINVAFTVAQFSTTSLQLKGNAQLKRSDFGVGQGEWAKTDAIKDEVKIDFTVSAVKK